MSPCLTCEYRYEDKNCSRCRHCEARIKYAMECDGENFRPIILDSPELKESMSDLDRDETIERALDSEEAREAIETICDEYQIDPEILLAGSNDRKAMLLPGMTRARNAAVKALRHSGMKKKEIGRFLNISYPAVCKHLRDEEPTAKPTANPWEAIETICREFGVDKEKVLHQHGRKAAAERMLIIASLRKDPYYVPLKGISEITGMNISKISKYVRAAKDEGLL